LSLLRLHAVSRRPRRQNTLLQYWSENIVLVELPDGPQTGAELDHVIHHVRDRGNCSVGVDFSNVTIVTSTALATLLRLNTLLDTCGQRLLLCGVGHATRGITSVTGLDDVFQIVDNRFDALTRLQTLPGSATASAEMMH
jgi:anti-anti-sigma regulatory factor